MNFIAFRLKQIRENMGVKIVDLAKTVNMSHSYLSEIEQGKKLPSFKTLQKLCSALGITLAEFFAEETPSLPPDLRQLLQEAESLTPEQRRRLIDFIRSMKGTNA